MKAGNYILLFYRFGAGDIKRPITKPSTGPWYNTRQCSRWAETTIGVRHQLTSIVWQRRRCSVVKCLVRRSTSHSNVIELVLKPFHKIL